MGRLKSRNLRDAEIARGRAGRDRAQLAKHAWRAGRRHPELDARQCEIVGALWSHSTRLQEIAAATPAEFHAIAEILRAKDAQRSAAEGTVYLPEDCAEQ